MWLGLDLGTTNVKALLVTDDGTVVSQGTASVALQHLANGGVEQDIEQIWQATLDAITQAGNGSHLSSVRAVGVSSQGAAIQIRTHAGQCSGPVFSWMDARSASLAKSLEQEKGVAWFAERAGHGSAGIAVGQVARLRSTEPESLRSDRCLGFVGDTIVGRLCGRAAHDRSSLSITGLYNPSLRDPDPDVLALIGLDVGQLPDLLEANEPAGLVTTGVAQATGLPAGIPVGPAIHDQYAAAIGCGAVEVGDVMFGAGTAWVLLAVADRLAGPIVPSAYVCDHPVAERWGQMFSLVVGGSAFQWALEMTGLVRASTATIDTMIESVVPGCDGLNIYPFFDGGGGPNRLAYGKLTGATLGHGPSHLLRATVEGLAFELARQLGWLIEADWPVKRLIVCGGMTKTRATPQIVADITGCPLVCPEQSETSAAGAAVLARAMVEPQASLASLARSMASKTKRIIPGASADGYVERREQYADAVTNMCKRRGDYE